MDTTSGVSTSRTFRGCTADLDIPTLAGPHWPPQSPVPQLSAENSMRHPDGTLSPCTSYALHITFAFNPPTPPFGICDPTHCYFVCTHPAHMVFHSLLMFVCLFVLICLLRRRLTLDSGYFRRRCPARDPESHIVFRFSMGLLVFYCALAALTAHSVELLSIRDYPLRSRNRRLIELLPLLVLLLSTIFTPVQPLP